MSVTSGTILPKKSSPDHSGDESSRPGDELQRSRLGEQNLGGEGAVLAVAADVPAQPLHNGVDAHQPEAVALPLCGGEQPAHLFQLLPGGEIGEGDVELGVLDVHVHPDEPPLLGQVEAGLDGVVKEVAQNAAQVDLRRLQPHRDTGVRHHLDALGPGQGDLGVEDGVGHGVAGLDDRVHGGQVLVQQVQVPFDGLPVLRRGIGLHGLDVVAVVVPPAPDLPVHVVHLPVVGLHQLLLVGGDLPVNPPGKEPHVRSPQIDNGPVHALIGPPGQGDGRAVAEPDFRPGHPADPGQVHNDRPARPVKAAVQLPLQVPQGHLHGDFPGGVDGHIVARNIGVLDLIDGDPDHLAARLEVQDLFVPGELFRRPVQHGEQLVLPDGLHQIVKGGHVVALGDVVGVAGDKDDLHRLVVPAQGAGHGHTVHGPHLNVQKQDVVVLLLGVVKEKFLGGGEKGGPDNVAPVGSPPVRQSGQVLPVRR